MVAVRSTLICSVAITPSLQGAAKYVWLNLGFLQWAAAISTAILTIGAVIEYWPFIKNIVVLTSKLFLLRTNAFERCTLRRMLFHSTGPLLVTIGIAGELLFETRAFIVEDEESAAMIDSVQTAKQAASAAKDDAQRAKNTADASATVAEIASATAGNALKKAGTANNQSVSAVSASGAAETKAASAAREADQIERRLAWRTLTKEEQSLLTTELTKSPKAHLRITIPTGNIEAEIFATQIAALLRSKEIGWQIELAPVMLFSNNIGLNFVVPSPGPFAPSDPLFSISKFEQAMDIFGFVRSSIVDSTLKSDEVVLIVGSNPASIP